MAEFGTIRCRNCGRDVPWTAETWDAEQQLCRECSSHLLPKAPPGTSQKMEPVQTGIGLTLLGLASGFVGLYYLFMAPGNPHEYGLSSGTVTIHRLYIGQ